jgi:hypothetical protein
LLPPAFGQGEDRWVNHRLRTHVIHLAADACARRRSPATLSSFHQGRPPRNKGQRYPADPPTVEEIIAVMHAAATRATAMRSGCAG